MAKQIFSKDSPLNNALLRFLGKKRDLSSGLVFNGDYFYDSKLGDHFLSLYKEEVLTAYIKITEIAGMVNLVKVWRTSQRYEGRLSTLNDVIEFIDKFTWDNNTLKPIDESNYTLPDPIDWKKPKTKD